MSKRKIFESKHIVNFNVLVHIIRKNRIEKMIDRCRCGCTKGYGTLTTTDYVYRKFLSHKFENNLDLVHAYATTICI